MCIRDRQKRATFIALQEHQTDQEKGEDQVDGEEDGFHERAFHAGTCRGYLGASGGRRKVQAAAPGVRGSRLGGQMPPPLGGAATDGRGNPQARRLRVRRGTGRRAIGPMRLWPAGASGGNIWAEMKAGALPVPGQCRSGAGRRLCRRFGKLPRIGACPPRRGKARKCLDETRGLRRKARNCFTAGRWSVVFGMATSGPAG